MFRFITSIIFISILYFTPVLYSNEAKSPLVDTVILKTDTTDTIGQFSDTIPLLDSIIKPDSVVLSGKHFKGIASFYSANLDGTKTATGEIFRNKKFTGASNHVKLNTWVRVTNLKNGKAVVVRINDRMHPRMKKKGRVIDLSRIAAQELNFISSGLTKVKIEVIEKPKNQ